MIEIIPSTSFQRDFKKRIKGNTIKENSFYKNIDLFINNPFDPKLKTHKLTGKLKDLWSFSIDYNLRVVFHWIDENTILLENIGSHDEVY